VKLDIEGAEINVLKDVIQQKRLTNTSCWLIEFHKEDIEKDGIVKEFKKEGFSFTRIKDVYCFVQGQ
jgi:hypothetical protein